jgi:RNA polymerase sigma-70 factor, ECF subfamily
MDPNYPSAAEIVRACLETGDAASWDAFVATFQPVIGANVARVVRSYGHPNPALTDDLIQDTFLRLCKDNCRALRTFKSQHDAAIFAYLKTIAISVAFDHFRAQKTQKRRGEVPPPDTDSDSEGGSTPPSTIEDAALINQFERRLAASQSERDCAIFWFHYRHGYTAKEIAILPGVNLSPKGVESCLHRLLVFLIGFTGGGASPAGGFAK